MSTNIKNSALPSAWMFKWVMHTSSIVVLLAITGCGDPQELSSAVSVQPLNLGTDEALRDVHRVIVKGDFTGPLRTVELEVDQTEYAFNEFGDPKPTGSLKKRSFTLRLTSIPASSMTQPQTQKEFDVYQVQEFQESNSGLKLIVPTPFPQDSQEQFVRLVHYQGDAGATLITLRNCVDENGPAATKAVAENSRWTTDVLATPIGSKKISFQQTSDSNGLLYLDPNHSSYSSDGLMTVSTLMGWEPRTVKVNNIKINDPTDQGRRLYELTTSVPMRTRYFVVIDDLGHRNRLIIKTDDELKFVSPLMPASN